MLLRENGYKFNVEIDKITKFLLSLAKRELELRDVEEWVKKNVKS